MAKRKYSRAEKQAYHSGMGYAVRHQNRNIDFKGGRRGRLYNSFMAGYKKALSMIFRNPSKYPKR